MHVPIVYSFFLSQFFGLYLFIMAMLMLSKSVFYQKLIMNLKTENAIIFLASSISLALGVALVETHNIWEWKPRVVITVLCWLILIKSILWLAMPDKMLHTLHKINKGTGYYVAVGLMAALGFLIFIGGLSRYIVTTTPQMVLH